MLVLYLESNTYAFTMMLATVLGGIALGSFVAAPCSRAASTGPAAGRRRIRDGDRRRVVVAVPVQGVRGAQPASTTWSALVDGDLEFVLIASALAILPTTVLMGVAFPIGVRLYVGDDPDPGRRIGAFYGLNVAAGIAGSLVAGFVLVPVLGTRRSLIVLVLASASAAVVLAVMAWEARRAADDRRRGAVATWSALVIGPVRCPTRTRRRCGTGIPTSGCCGSRRAPRPP